MELSNSGASDVARQLIELKANLKPLFAGHLPISFNLLTATSLSVTSLSVTHVLGTASFPGEESERRQNKPPPSVPFAFQIGKSTPQRIRTSNLRFRRPMLYPIELGVRAGLARLIGNLANR